MEAARFENSAQTRFLWKRTYTLADRKVKGKLLRDCGKLRVKGYVTVQNYYQIVVKYGADKEKMRISEVVCTLPLDT